MRLYPTLTVFLGLGSLDLRLSLFLARDVAATHDVKRSHYALCPYSLSSYKSVLSFQYSAAHREHIPWIIGKMIYIYNINLEPPRNFHFFRLGYSGIRIISGIYSGYSASGSTIAGMEIQVFRNENSTQANAYSHYFNYFYPGLIPNERALSYLLAAGCPLFFSLGQTE